MIVSGHQANYLPNLAFFAKMSQVDLFVVTTNIQLNDWVRRNYVQGPHGNIWLTVPVQGSDLQPIRDARISNGHDWASKHYHALRGLCSHADPDRLLPVFKSIYARRQHRLADLNWQLIQVIADLLDIHTKLILDEEVTGSPHQKSALVVRVCQKYHVQNYLAGAGGRQYMNEQYMSDLTQAGITCQFMSSSVSEKYPYSTIQYLLTKGIAWTKEQVHASTSVVAAG